MQQPPDGWTPVEQGLWEAFRQGEVYDLRSWDSSVDQVSGPHDWPAERFVRAEVLATLLLNGPDPAPGKVAALKLSGAYVTGALLLAGARIDHYIELHDCRFEKKILMSEAQAGTVRMIRCWIPRLEASRLATDGDLHLARCVLPFGMRLTDAKIGTDLLLNQATIGGDRYGRALAADGLTVQQDCEAERIDVHGELSLRTGRIGGRFSLRGARLKAAAPDRYCLNLAHISVGNTMYLGGSLDGGWAGSHTIYGDGYGAPIPPGSPSTPLRAYGGVRLVDGRFENALLITHAEFHLAEGQELSLRRIQTPELRFTCHTPPTGKVSLSRARIGNLVDNPASWPMDGHVRMTGFTYESLRPDRPFSVRQRIAWLESALGEYQPEPYEQLATALRRDGRDEDAREVLYAKHQRRRSTLPLPGRLWGLVQDAAVGYGYRPGRAALWLVLAWAIGALYFSEHEPAPLKADERPTWNAPLYALSKVLPVVNLGPDGWNPDRTGQFVVAGLVLSGWVLATTVVAGATRMLQRG
ncbi:oxidoreductase [Kitasatospora sp. NPDC101801]|uniref:oxidoreductase n=1 Tax=Kitasatospora sp. NPDC101801 TaxID=3364103 RepID=UPI003829842E